MKHYLLISPMTYGYCIQLFDHDNETLSCFDHDYAVPSLHAANVCVAELNRQQIAKDEQPYPVFIWDVLQNQKFPFTINNH